MLYSAGDRARPRARRVVEGRLFYCTTAGGFGEHPIPINDYTQRQGLEVLEIVDRAVEQGFLAAAPAEARLHVVRLPAGLRPARRGTRSSGRPKDRSGRPRGAEVDAMSILAFPARTMRRRAAPSATTSTTRSSSKRRPAPARRPSSSTGSCACSRPAGRR